MKVVSIGGGPAGLYLSILLKRQDPTVDITVYERHRADDTFGFGVVFSDATLSNLRKADPKTFSEIEKEFFHWDDIITTSKGKVFRSKGHGFCGLERKRLLCILQKEAHSLGVDLKFETEVNDFEALKNECDVLVAADGAFSRCRDAYKDHFGPKIDWRPNRFVWLGTTVPYDAFTFHFKETTSGLFRVHAYRYGDVGSTFIVECKEETLTKMGLEPGDEDQTIDAMQKVFKEELLGHSLIKNRSIWRQFPTVSNKSWVHDNIVLVGDSAHTAHFSIGSGTKLAMEDCIDLASTLVDVTAVPDALKQYELKRRPTVKKVQKAAQTSLEWFENTERVYALEPLQFTYSLLTRSLRVTHENLRKRDPQFVGDIEREYFDGGAPVFHRFRTEHGSLSNRFVAQAPQSRDDECFYDLPLDAQMYRLAPVLQSGAGLVFLPRLDLANEFSPSKLDNVLTILKASKKTSSSKCGVSIVNGLGFEGKKDGKLFEAFIGNITDVGVDCLEIDVTGSTGLSCSSFVEDSIPSIEKKCQPLIKSLNGVRKVHRHLLLLRLSVRDWLVDKAKDLETSVRMVNILKDTGVNVFSITSKNHPQKNSRLYQAELADHIKTLTHGNVLVEGGLDSLDDMNSLIAAGRADLVRLEESLWYNPAFIRLAARKHQTKTTFPSHLSSLADYNPRSFIQ